MQSFGSIEAHNDVTGAGNHKAPTGEYAFGHPVGPRGTTNKSTGDWFVPIIGSPDQPNLGLHGGGKGAPDPFEPEQKWIPTFGCIRVHNKDLEWITGLILLDEAAGESSKILIENSSPKSGLDFLNKQQESNPFLQ